MTSASPVSIVRDPMIAASRDEPHSRLTVVAGIETRRACEQHSHPADVAVVLAGLVRAPPHDLTHLGRIEVGNLREHALHGGGREVGGS